MAHVYLICDQPDVLAKAKSLLEANGVFCETLSSDQVQEKFSPPDLVSGNRPQGFDSQSNIISFPSKAPVAKVQTFEEMETKAIQSAISQYRGNLTEAAKALGIGRATLYRKVKLYQIDPNASRRRRAA